ncbi:MAG TPA: hypothetical protein PLA87_16985 [Pseudomonadota bacterium]|jgi:hypothetical protein|nr:hypothetical protein [Pseudomonadota bacterium]
MSVTSRLSQSAADVAATISGLPALRKGALIHGAMLIPFQYNPERLTRTLSANSVGQAGADLLRLKGPPGERITLDILLDAADQNARQSGLQLADGIYPALSALEMLLYPSAARVLTNAALARLGIIELIPPLPVLTVLVWGTRRVVPVRVESFTVTEEHFDSALNPLRATVALGLQVLTYEDLGLWSVGGMLSMAGHLQREVLAVSAAVQNTRSAAAATGLDLNTVGKALKGIL